MDLIKGYDSQTDADMESSDTEAEIDISNGRGPDSSMRPKTNQLSTIDKRNKGEPKIPS